MHNTWGWCGLTGTLSSLQKEQPEIPPDPIEKEDCEPVPPVLERLSSSFPDEVVTLPSLPSLDDHK